MLLSPLAGARSSVGRYFTPGWLLSLVQAHYCVSTSKPELQLQGGERGQWILRHRQPLPTRTCRNNHTGAGTCEADGVSTAAWERYGKNTAPAALGNNVPTAWVKGYGSVSRKRLWGCRQESPRCGAAKQHQCQREKAAVMGPPPLKPTGLSASGIHGTRWGTKGAQPINCFWLDPHLPFLIQVSKQGLPSVLRLNRLD